MTRRRMAAAAAVIVVVFGVLTWRNWSTLFGAGTWGAGGNMFAWVACGGLAFGWTWLRQHERHLQQLAQNARHHHERLEQADAHHEAQVALARKHHQEQLDRADVHHEALKQHVVSVVPQPATRRKPPAPKGM